MSQDLRQLDKQAIALSQQYWGGFAGGTVLTTVVITAGFIATLAGAASGSMPLWLATLFYAGFTYLAYTPLHEAAHGNIHGNNKKLQWVGDVCGYIAAQIILVPHSTHKFEHMAHHRHTNVPDKDPDLVVKGFGERKFFSTVVRFLWSVHAHAFQHGGRKITRKDKQAHILEVCSALLWRAAFLTQVPLAEGLILLVGGYLLGAFFTVYWFAFRPHHPYSDDRRYRNTNSMIMPAWMKPVRWFWMGQDLHSIHHLFPRVPFYRYRALFNDIEPILREKGNPIIGMYSRQPVR